MSTALPITPLEAKQHVQEYLGVENFSGTNPSNLLHGAVYPSGRNDVCVLTHEERNGSESVVKQLICVYRYKSGDIRAQVIFKTRSACSLCISGFELFERAIRVHFNVIPRVFTNIQKKQEDISL